ncbi:MAG: hypothetical protein H6696_05515 [Deferribacteres bacterium]|nr:hypothetical protein [candidate division KSB1 bacterium]MCB9501376.1 hypothetical protein [Deferribacteres bacterium]
MEKILSFIAKETSGICYKSFKYCFEGIEVPKVIYDDKQSITVRRSGETDKGLTSSKSIIELAQKISRDNKPLFKYFLDGSRRTYKVDDIAYGNRLYPIIAGQIGVACCQRKEPNSFKKALYTSSLALALPECANKDNLSSELYFNSVIQKLNSLASLKNRKISIQKLLPYPDRALKEGEKYEHKGIAKIHDEMIETEKRFVKKMVHEKMLNLDSYLLKDGSLQYQKMKSGDFRDLCSLKSNYQCVVGASKAFNPELCKDKNNRSIAKQIADLELFYRTPAFMYETERVPGVSFSVWYLRLRDVRKTVNPFDGILKIEKVLVTDSEEENGLDSDEIDRISANIINERNPTCYASDNRWANHLYPIYLTENFIKSNYLSDTYFLNLF